MGNRLKIELTRVNAAPVDAAFLFINIYFLLFLFLPACFLAGCNHQKTGILTHKVEITDFVNKINVPGFIEAKTTRSMTCPNLGSNATIVYLIPEGQWVKKGDTVCILEAHEVTTRYLNAVKELENAKAEYNKSLASLELQYIMLESQVKLIESSTAIKELSSVQLQFISPSRRKILELQLQKAAIEKEKLENKLTLLEKINKSELHKMQLRIRQCENRVNEEKSKVDLLTVKSNAEGMVLYSTLWFTGEKFREGDVVWNGMEIIKIPDMTGMVIKCFVNETHYKQIEKDQKIDITFDAHPEIQLTGRIRNKASVGKPIKEKSNVKVFEITAALDSAEFVITPGLSVSCNVYINEVANAIVVPVVSVFSEDSTRIVYVANGSKYTRQIVTTAQHSANDIIITHGLNGGELIALGEPRLSLIKEGIEGKNKKDNL